MRKMVQPHHRKTAKEARDPWFVGITITRSSASNVRSLTREAWLAAAPYHLIISTSPHIARSGPAVGPLFPAPGVHFAPGPVYYTLQRSSSDFYNPQSGSQMLLRNHKFWQAHQSPLTTFPLPSVCCLLITWCYQESCCRGELLQHWRAAALPLPSPSWATVREIRLGGPPSSAICRPGVGTVPTMSSCPHCYVGLCKKHKMQDHGRREQALLASKQEISKKLYETLVQPQLAKINAEKAANSAKEQEKYRQVSGNRGLAGVIAVARGPGPFRRSSDSRPVPSHWLSTREPICQHSKHSSHHRLQEKHSTNPSVVQAWP